MNELTLSIIKPDAIINGYLGSIFAKIEQVGLSIIAAKMMHLSKEQAAEFYAVHRERPFFESLITFMSSGPVMVSVLSGEDAVKRYRDLMGATNPQEAKKGTIRAEFAESIEANAVHGSDGAETAAVEIPFFFQENEVFPYEVK